MRRTFIFVSCLSILFFVSCKKTDDELPETKESDKFKITVNQYSSTNDNLEDAVLAEFGSDYRIADWSDLLLLEDPQKWIEDLRIEENTTLLLTYNGNHIYSSDRHYFMTYHNHQLPSNYLSHDNIDNHLIDLGSWNTTDQILCIKK